MINIDFLTLKAFLSENYNFIAGARIQKIQQPTRRDFIFVLRNNAEMRKLYININPQIYHIAFMSKTNEMRRNVVIPSKPPMFCMLLRKYLEGCKIKDARVVENERILEFYFETTDEYSIQRSLCLCIELMGKHSNVILYDKCSSVIIGCAHNVGAEKSRYRELQGGLKYIYPPVHKLSLSQELSKQFSKLAQDEINVYLKSEEFRPALAEDTYTLFAELLPEAVVQSSVNAMLDNYYSKFQEQISLQTDKNKLKEVVNAKIKRIRNSSAKILLLLKKRDNTDKYKLYGELLTANSYQKNSDYHSSIDIYDYINDKNIEIELDNNLSIAENAQRYYKLYAKAKKTKENAEKMLENLTLEAEYYENILYAINSADKLSDLDDIKSELKPDDVKPKRTEKSEIMKVRIGEFDVYVGKNNKQNDFIVSKLAKDEDYWFHTRLCAGSHVLLKVQNIEPDEDVIFECCKLARKYSSASQPSKVGVIYTRAKNLRKPPAAHLGYVTYKNEKEILI